MKAESVVAPRLAPHVLDVVERVEDAEHVHAVLLRQLTEPARHATRVRPSNNDAGYAGVCSRLT
jgi:hypothetical protein